MYNMSKIAIPHATGVLVILAAVLVSGCTPGLSNIQESYRTDPAVISWKSSECTDESANKVGLDQSPSRPDVLCPIDLDTFKFPGDTTTAFEAAYLCDPAKQSNVSCKRRRDDLQQAILDRSEKICKKHLSDIAATSAYFNTTLGLTAVTLSTISAAVGGETAKTLFSTGASVAGAGQSIMNKEIYKDYVAPAVIKAIKDDRAKKLSEMTALRSKPLDDYSLLQALTDANNYHERCAFSEGLVLLTEGAERRVSPTSDELEVKIQRKLAAIKELERSMSATSTAMEIKTVEKTKESLRVEIQFLQSRISTLAK